MVILLLLDWEAPFQKVRLTILLENLMDNCVHNSKFVLENLPAKNSQVAVIKDFFKRS